MGPQAASQHTPSVAQRLDSRRCSTLQIGAIPQRSLVAWTNLTASPVAVELGRAEKRGGLQDFVGPAQLPDFTLELADALPLARGHAWPAAIVHLVLAYPSPQVSLPMPSLPAMDSMAAHSVGYS